MKRLATAGYCVTPHWKVGTFRIDLVVEGDSKRLAIECDGDRYQPLEKLPEDMERQSVLERMGWIFARIRSSEFLRNPARAMKPIFEKLEALGIPAAGKTRQIQEGPTSHEVIDQVLRRAEELRKSWSKASGVGAAPAPAAVKV
jgi:very-short-patch-repair endonuclease